MTQTFTALRDQLLGAAEAFTEDPRSVSGILSGIVEDVDRALTEKLEIFPVCHHSPASALAMARRLREKRPSVIYLELCEDLRPILGELRNCRLPVALQAFASDLDGFPPGAGPLSVVAPVTESSAEYQAIAYALDNPDVELVLVDRSVDHVFQWSPELKPEKPSADVDDPEEAAMHGESVGIEIGDLRPGFAELEEHLVHHGKVRHWSEWWDQYVEQPLVDADYDSYRQVMVLIGSLFRRLRPSDRAKEDRDEDRERYMWTRMRQHLASSGADPERVMYVCGAFHAASRVAEFGLDGADTFEITDRTATKWLYGLIPSSHSAIEAQFGLAPGSVSIASATWEKAVRAGAAKPFRLAGQKGGKKPAKAAKAVAPKPPEAVTDKLSGFLAAPSALAVLDEDELRGWCVDIVRLARRHGYLASTADAIAVYETSILLAGMRNRSRPTPYDFQDAAVTCIEKDAVPGRRDVRRLCEILLGGDRVGQVGYDSLPPLARDVLDRLAPLGLDLEKRTLQRALMDLDAKPELRACSRVLWMLRYLLPEGALKPIMGSKELGKRSIQESWDLWIGREQRALIELGYEGVTLEQVFELRLRKSVWDAKATASDALRAVEDSILYLDNPRFTEELGERAVELLSAERTVDDAPEVLKRVRRLLAYYRANEPALPRWTELFVTGGYGHYCTLLPTAFSDEDSGVRQVAAMLGFLFTLENLALSLGCDRAQLELAVRQSHPEAPGKVALLWAAHTQIGVLTIADLRERCADMLSNPLVIPTFPQYLSGFIQALDPVPPLAGFVVELLSGAFAKLPDAVLLPWLPTLITTLKKEAAEYIPMLAREAGRMFPGTLPAVDAWTPPWVGRAEPVAAVGAVPAGPVAAFLAGRPESADAVAALLGCPPGWREAGPGAGAAGELVASHPATVEAVAALIA
ncbi:hypothetical protein Afil01_62490 [Actinorhabdospora filicis]|uniref:Uncharacterized protein n=1 Tax=Actinorhabdospora filicis TaxID=1785913 RepID=A0A9W6W6E3_9ACTN|nr:DUF5682 family protein [Actinorhabdospora filicis]GLZ81442.1 hypothetical protein Afil01_62490 [Actinorhabdospora filicis]